MATCLLDEFSLLEMLSSQKYNEIFAWNDAGDLRNFKLARPALWMKVPHY